MDQGYGLEEITEKSDVTLFYSIGKNTGNLLENDFAKISRRSKGVAPSKILSISTENRKILDFHFGAHTVFLPARILFSMAIRFYFYAPVP